MIGPNLSEWAIHRRSLLVFLMIAAVVAGTLSFLRLGRAEDPVFTFRTMIVFAAWPGATQEETLLQVTERIERKLQETRHLNRIRSYTVPGFTTIFVDLKGSTSPNEVPDVWYQVRKNIGDIRLTLPPGVIGPGFNDDFGDTFGIIYGFTADGFTQRELRDYVEDARSRLLLVPDVSKIEILGAQDERIFIEFSTDRLAGLGLDYPSLLATLQAQNIVRPAGVLETGAERVSLRVSGALDNEDDIRKVNFQIEGRMIRLGDIADVRRGFVDPPQPMFRVNGKSAIGLAIAMRDGGDILALGANITKEMADIRGDLPLGIEPTLVADQAVTVDTAIGEFMESLWQAIVIILVCSFIALGVRPGAVVALAIPLTLAIVFAVMEITGIDLQRISLGALIIALHSFQDLVNSRLPLVHEVGHPKEFLNYPHADIMYFDYMPPCMEVFDKDVYVVDNSSAGGLGDPIERDPALQKADLDNGLTNEEISRNMYCIAVHYDKKAKEWTVDDEETRKLRAARRKERLSRGVPPVEQYWQQARQRILDKKLDPLLLEAYRSSMKLSQGFTRDYKDFWALPNDFAF